MSGSGHRHRPARWGGMLTPMSEQITVTLYLGPLDGETLIYDRGDLDEDTDEWGAYMIVPGERALPEDPGARAVYEPAPGADPLVWLFRGWVP